MSDALARAIGELDEEEAIRLATEEIHAQTDAAAVLDRCRAGLWAVGERFEKKEYFLSELVFSARIVKRISDLVEDDANTKGKPAPPAKGTVVIGALAGDVHDIGKNIAGGLLECFGYRVEDLGVDVPPEAFVQKARETGARVVAMSALITNAFQGMKKVVELLEAEGLRPPTKVMIGGGIVDERSLRFTGADAQSRNPFDLVKFCDRLFEADAP